MGISTYTAGLQHIGIPTDNFEQTVKFYEKLGFHNILQTYNEKGKQRIAFLEMGNLVFEIYEEKKVAKSDGAINHVAINTTDIEACYHEVCEMNCKVLSSGIESMDLWENGVRFFIIEGPNKERIEFCRRL